MSLKYKQSCHEQSNHVLSTTPVADPFRSEPSLEAICLPDPRPISFAPSKASIKMLIPSGNLRRLALRTEVGKKKPHAHPLQNRRGIRRQVAETPTPSWKRLVMSSANALKSPNTLASRLAYQLAGRRLKSNLVVKECLKARGMEGSRYSTIKTSSNKK